MDQSTRDGHIELRYGAGALTVLPPPGAEVAVARPAPWPDPRPAEEVVATALAAPISSPLLRELVRPRQRVVIVVSDHTRQTGAAVVLPRLLRELEHGGVAATDVCVLIAVGTHRSPTPAEIAALLGPELAGRLEVAVHDCSDEANLVPIGRTSFGTEVLVNRLAAEADHVVLTGGILPHYFAGMGGGRKSVLPGIAAWRSIEQNHLRALDPRPGHGANPEVAAGKLDGNPVSQDMEEAAELLRPSFLLNTALDQHGHICAAWAGHPREAFRRGAAEVLARSIVDLRWQADVVLASAGGQPRDDSYFQAHKALEHASYAVKPGGTAILVAACAEGVGPESFARWLALGGSATIEPKLRAHFELFGRTALASWTKAERLWVLLVSDLSAEQTAALGMAKAASAQEALAMALDRTGATPRLCILPESEKSLPRLATES